MAIRRRRKTCPNCDGTGYIIEHLAVGELGGEEEGSFRRTDPFTSKEAGARLKPSRVERVILYDLDRNGAAASYLITKRTGRANNTITPRLAPMREKGLVRIVGWTVNPLTSRRVLVWGLRKKKSVEGKKKSGLEDWERE